MPDLGLDLPAGTTLVSLAERPDLREPVGDHNVGVWPAFMLESAVADRLWHHLFDDWPSFQLAFIDADERVLAAHNAAPLAWDGTDGGLTVHDLSGTPAAPV